ncbi:MAG: hypothetical protein JNM90_25320 [Burkholderiales bacterium]|nr:hypothetical protein [Burkholderiales bacterium]
MSEDTNQELATLAGRFAVLNEVVIAMLAALPNRDSVLRLAMRNAQGLREAALDGDHTRSWVVGVDAQDGDLTPWLAGVDVEINAYQSLAAHFATKRKPQP